MADYRHPSVALHERTRGETRFVQNFDMAEPFHDLFPENAELQLAEAIADATVDPEAK